MNDTDVLSRVDYISHKYISPSICLFGIVCNFINLVVLLQPVLKGSPYTYLTTIGFADISNLILYLLFSILLRLNINCGVLLAYNAYVIYGLMNILSTTGIWTIVLVTIERFNFVRSPLNAKTSCNRKQARPKIICVILAAIVVNLPRFFCYRVEQDDMKCSLQPTEFQKSTHYKVIVWIYSAILNFIPLSILIMVNMYLVYAVRRSYFERVSMRENMPSEHVVVRDHVRLNITLISIITMFIICVMPSAFADKPVAAQLFWKDIQHESLSKLDDYRILAIVSNYLLLLNASLNFVLYCAFNIKYRRVLKWVARRCWLRIHPKHQDDVSFTAFYNKRLHSSNILTHTSSI